MNEVAIKTNYSVWRLGVVPVLILQTACIGSTPPAQFYLLEPLAVETPRAPTTATGPWVLSMAPVRLPAYLDRSQIVTATDKNTYQMDELHRWAESLGDNMTRVLLQDLSVLLAQDVVISTAPHARQASWHLAVTVLNFHVTPQGMAELNAQWQVSRDGKAVLLQRSALQVPVEGEGVQARVQALNRCLDHWSQDIARALLTVVATPAGESR